MALPYDDQLSSPDGALNDRQDWTAFGNWPVSGGTVLADPGGTTHSHARFSPAVLPNNYRLRVRCRFPVGANWYGIFGRGLLDGINTQYYGLLTDGSTAALRQYRRTATGWSAYGNSVPVTIVQNTWYWLEIEFEDSTIRTYLDGMLLDEQTDTNLPNGGVVGLTLGTGGAGANTVEYDAIEVIDLAGQVIFSGDLNALLSGLDTTLIGNHGTAGDVLVALADINALIEGAHGTGSNLAATLGGIQADLQGSHLPAGISGDLAAALNGIAATIDGVHGTVGNLTATLTNTAGDYTVAHGVAGQLSLDLSGITAQFQGTHVPSGVGGDLSVALNGISTAIDGVHGIGGDLVATLTDTAGNYTGAHGVAGQLSSDLSGITVQFQGSHVPSGVVCNLSGALSGITAALQANHGVAGNVLVDLADANMDFFHNGDRTYDGSAHYNGGIFSALIQGAHGTNSNLDATLGGITATLDATYTLPAIDGSIAANLSGIAAALQANHGVAGNVLVDLADANMDFFHNGDHTYDGSAHYNGGIFSALIEGAHGISSNLSADLTGLEAIFQAGHIQHLHTGDLNADLTGITAGITVAHGTRAAVNATLDGIGADFLIDRGAIGWVTPVLSGISARIHGQHWQISASVSLAETGRAAIDSLPLPIKQIRYPDQCPANLLPWLAWDYSVDIWDSIWSEQTQRDVIDASVFVHRHKGTPAAVLRALEAMNYDNVRIFERDVYLYDGTYQYDSTIQHGGGLGPFQFDVVLNTGSIPDAAEQTEIRRRIDHFKNTRSRLRQLRYMDVLYDGTYQYDGNVNHNGGIVSG